MFKDRYSVQFSGSIKQLHCQQPNATVQFQIIAKPPWNLLFGATTGVSQTALRASNQTQGHGMTFN